MHPHAYWLTRPQGEGAALIAALTHAGAKIYHSPVMHIETLDHAPSIAPSTHVILTSKHACHSLRHVPTAQHVWCVGSSLAEHLRGMGYTNLSSYPKASALMKDFTSRIKPPATLHYLRGDVVRMDVTSLLRAQHYTCEETICYRTHPAPMLSRELHAAVLQGVTLTALFYSVQAVGFAFELLRASDAGITPSSLRAICMSSQIAAEAKRRSIREIITAPAPHGSAMLECALADHASRANLKS